MHTTTTHPTDLFRQLKMLRTHTFTTRELIFGAALVICLTPFMSPPLALLLGLLMAQFVGHPFLHLNSKVTHWLLQASVVGLGFGMNMHSAIQAGKEEILFTVVSIAGTLTVGILLGKWLKIDRVTAHLIAAGTAICGGSAIAALSPVMRAQEKQVSVSLGTIFILNSVALIAFPLIGQWLHLTPAQFGLWCALAIHDTSSVVGSSHKVWPGSPATGHDGKTGSRPLDYTSGPGYGGPFSDGQRQHQYSVFHRSVYSGDDCPHLSSCHRARSRPIGSSVSHWSDANPVSNRGGSIG